MSTPFFKEVWVIDDEEMSVFYTENLLRLNTFSSEVKSFLKAREALNELEKLKLHDAFPDIIFLDLNMPDFDGWDFLKAFRKFPLEIRKRCTLYILSSSVDENDINKSKAYEDVRDFLCKPIDKICLEVVKFQNK